MKVLLQLQDKILKYHLRYMLIVACMTIILMLSQSFYIDNSFLIMVMFSGIFLQEWMYRKAYYNRRLFYITTKCIIAIGVAGTMALTDFIYSVLAIIYILLIIFELYISLPSEEPKYRYFILIFQVMIFPIAALLRFGRGIIGADVAFVLLAILFFGYSVYDIFRTQHRYMTQKLESQIRLFEEAEKTNEQLRRSQAKFKLIHDEMAKQKNDLMSANERLNKMTSEIYTQNELLRYISSVLDIRELIDLVTDAIIGTIGVDTCGLVLFDEKSETYLYSVKSNYPGNHIDQLRKRVDSGYLEKYFESARVHLNNHVNRENYEFVEERPVGSIAVIPLLRETGTYGLLIAEHSTTDMFTENNVQFFRGISTQITIAINNASVYALMEEMARKDGLTGIYNRKYLQDHIHEYIERANLKNQSLAVALLDIDHFKSVNDRYGHLFGDQAIKMTASKVQDTADRCDGLAVRYGGEEFVLVLPNVDREKAQGIVEELHRTIAEEKLSYSSKTSVRINVSIGVSFYPEIAESGEDLLLRADNAMYYSKEHGRGRITIDSKDLEKVV